MAHWHLISHLSLNYLSLVEEGRQALQQILGLYDFTDSPSTGKMIEGISALNSRRHFARVFVFPGRRARSRSHLDGAYRLLLVPDISRELMRTRLVKLLQPRLGRSVMVI